MGDSTTDSGDDFSSLWNEVKQDPSNYIKFFVAITIIVIVRIYLRVYLNPRTKNTSTKSKIVLKELFIYPVKSCAGILVKSAEVGKYGLINDRRWMIYSTTNNRFVTQRQNPKMALVKPSFKPNHLCLEFPNFKSLEIPLNSTSKEIVKDIGLWDASVRGVDEGDEAAKWFQDILGREDVRLIRMPEDHDRNVPSKWKQNDLKSQFVSYADGFPFLLASMESLKDLNDRITNKQKDLPIKRFRANFIIEGQETPFAEDTWKKIKIGDCVFRVVKKCTRCKITTVDPDKGEFDGQEPLNTLSTFRKGLLEGKDEVCFAQNLIQEKIGGVVRIGDSIQILK
jgi:uncharacterized protein YcbX